MSFNLYTFGCSFTKYVWPTWADILGKHADEYKNFGWPGAGNYYIFNRLINFLTTKEIEEKDIILICWSRNFREDRLKNNEWIHSGDIFVSNVEEYNEDFIEKFFDIDHYIERDRTLIIAAIELLNAKKINYIMFSIEDVFFTPEKNLTFLNNFFKRNIFLTDNVYSKQFSVWNFFKSIKPNTRYDYYKSLFQPSLDRYVSLDRNRPMYQHDPSLTAQIDVHPTPLEHLKYVEEILIPKLNLDIKISDKNKKEINELDNFLSKTVITKKNFLNIKRTL